MEPAFCSVAIFAWNEEKAIAKALASLFQQSVFEGLSSRGLSAEVFCVLNGCTDGTAEAAREFYSRTRTEGPPVIARFEVVELADRGKLNAWNHFVHRISASETRYLFMMDADIVIRGRDTLFNMLALLEGDPDTSVAVDTPCKDISLKENHSWRERLSLRAAGVTYSAEAQLCAQLYCMRAEVARKIYLPKDLSACEDGFIKELVCTDFLTKESNPSRIKRAQNAEHVFEAYTSLAALVRNQKRQVMGQTVIHLLVDQHLKELPASAREHLAETLRQRDAEDPLWLRRLISAHLARVKFFWRVCPTYVGTSFRRLRKLPFPQRLRSLPAASACFVLSLAGSFLADRALRMGCMDYWPRVERRTGRPTMAGGRSRCFWHWRRTSNPNSPVASFMHGTVPQKIGRIITNLALHPGYISRCLAHNVLPGRTPLDLEIPWFSYAAIDFLEAYLRPEMKVFEYGSGGSTLFFARRTQSVLSVEDNPKWFELVTHRLQEKQVDNAVLKLCPFDFKNPAGFEESDYLNALPNEKFDVIVVDGSEEWTQVRPVCFRKAEGRVKPNGIIVVDDSWRYVGCERTTTLAACGFFKVLGHAGPG